MNVKGRIKVIKDTQSYGGNGFQKREFVLTTDEQYPQHLLIELVQDNCVLLDNYEIGDAVEVSINLRGREWVNPQGETKYFNSINAWRLQRVVSKMEAAVNAIDKAIPPADNTDVPY